MKPFSSITTETMPLLSTVWLHKENKHISYYIKFDNSVHKRFLSSFTKWEEHIWLTQIWWIDKMLEFSSITLLLNYKPFSLFPY